MNEDEKKALAEALAKVKTATQAEIDRRALPDKMPKR